MSQSTPEPGAAGSNPPPTGAGQPTIPSVSSVTATTTATAAIPGPGPAAETPRSGAARPASTGPKRKARPRHARVVVRKVGPWTVFKVSMVFYLCVMLALLGAGVILYGLLGAIGVLDSLEKLADELGFGPGFTVHGSWLFTRGLWYGLAMVIVGSLINVFAAFLYNLISDLVGGVEITLAERR